MESVNWGAILLFRRGNRQYNNAMLRYIFILIFSMLIVPKESFALDWKKLHEAADKRGLEDAAQSAKMNPHSIGDLYIYGLVSLTRHEDDQALRVFESMLKLDPKCIEAQWGKAEVLRRKGKLEESQVILKEVITLSTDFAPAYITLAYIKYTQLNFKEAIKLSEKVLRQGRDKVDIRNYARAYLIIGGSRGMLARRGGPLAKVFNGVQALPNLKKAEALQPNSAAVLYGLGSFYFLAPPLAGGDRNKAKDYLQRAIKADPLLADAYVRLAQVHKNNRDVPKARELLKKALEIDPNNALALDAISNKCKFACVSMQD